jgi:PDZ domain-containing protein
VNRRALTLTLGSALAVALTLGGTVTTVPYVSLEPGPTYDTLSSEGTQGEPVIEIAGRPTFPTTGKLDLTTVSVTPRLTLGAALWGWFDSDRAVLPRELVYPPDQTDEEVEQANQKSMEVSQNTASAAALRELDIRSEVVTVAEVPDGPSKGVLQVGDVLVEVDGKAVLDGVGLRLLIGERQPGEQVRIGYRRGTSKEVRQAVLTTAASPQDPNDPEAPPRPIIGVQTETDPVADFSVTINLVDVGGPSAGLMFALGIVDKLDKTDLTGGRHVAGTGSITADGKVGPIGGITQKLLGARRKGATVFLVPADNCAEASGNVPDGLTLVRTATLRDALVGLRVLRDGGTPVGC